MYPPIPPSKILQDRKKDLRQAQRKLMAEYRRRKYEEIMAAMAHNMQLLYKLIRKQRGGGKGPISKDINFEGHKIPTYIPECNKWAMYYEDLAMPKDLPEYDSFYANSYAVRRLVISTLPDEEPPPQITLTQTLKDIKKMSNNKAPDIYGIA